MSNLDVNWQDTRPHTHILKITHQITTIKIIRMVH